jgi:hypothetical protein
MSGSLRVRVESVGDLRLIRRNDRFALESGHPSAPGNGCSVPKAVISRMTMGESP